MSENTARKVVISTYRMAWLVPASQQPLLNAPGTREKNGRTSERPTHENFLRANAHMWS